MRSRRGDRGLVVRFAEGTGSAFVHFERDGSFKHWIARADFGKLKQADGVSQGAGSRDRGFVQTCFARLLSGTRSTRQLA